MRISFRNLIKYNPNKIPESIFKQMTFFNPIIAIVFTVLYTGLNDFFWHFVASYLVATLISLQIFLIDYLVWKIEARIRMLRHKPARVPPKVWWFAISMSAMPFAYFTSMKYLAPAIGPLIGIHIESGAFEFGPPILIGALIGFGFFSWGSFHDAKESLAHSNLEIEELKGQHLHARLSALTAQMNPHLLFNSLNTVAALVKSNPDLAEQTIVSLSELYRGVLESSRNMIHTLQEELDLCEAYLKIEKARFGERIEYRLRVSEDLDPSLIEIPSLLIQPLVENSVKHGISRRARGGKVHLSVSASGGQVVILVQDDGVGLGGSNISGTGAGIRNGQDRVRLHYGNLGSFNIKNGTSGGVEVEIRLPMSGAKT